MQWFTPGKPWAFVLFASVAAMSSIMLYQMMKANRKQLQDEDDQDLQESSKHETSTKSSPKKVEKSNEKKSVETIKPLEEETIPKVEDCGRSLSVQATSEYKLGNYAKAIELYTQAINSNLEEKGRKEDLKVMYSNCAAANEKLKKFEQVIESCTKALELDNRYVKAYRRRGNAFVQMKELSKALVDFLCIITLCQLSGKEPEKDLVEEITRVHKLVTQAETSNIVNQKKNSQRPLPASFFLNSYFQSFYTYENEPDLLVLGSQSLASLNDLLASYVETPQEEMDDKGSTIFLRGMHYLKEKNYELAAKDFKMACTYLTETHDHYASAQLLYGTFEHLQGNFEQAKTCFEACLSKNPKSIYAHVRMAGLCFDQKLVDEALSWFDKVMEIDPKSPTAFYHRGQLHSLSGNHEKAMEDLNHCLSLAPDFPFVYLQLGMCKARLQDYQSGYEFCSKAVELFPSMVEGYNHLGEILVGLEKVEEAIKIFDQAIEFDPTYPLAYVNKGILLLQRQDGASALKLLQKAIEVDPQCQIAYLHISQLCLQLGEAKTALRQLDTAIEQAYTKEEVEDLVAMRVTADAQLSSQMLLSA